MMGYKGVVNNLQGGGVSVLSANHIAVIGRLYQIGVEALTTGSIVFHCVWVPLSDGANVVAGAGGTL